MKQAQYDALVTQLKSLLTKSVTVTCKKYKDNPCVVYTGKLLRLIEHDAAWFAVRGHKLTTLNSCDVIISCEQFDNQELMISIEQIKTIC